LLLAVGTYSAALPHDEEGPCAGLRGILFAAIFDLCLSIYFVVFGDLGFFVFQLFFNLLCLRDAQSFSTGIDPAMSSEAQGGLPRAQASRQGSQAHRGSRQRKQSENQEEKKVQKGNGFITS
jgi:hypothetical protein